MKIIQVNVKAQDIFDLVESPSKENILVKYCKHLRKLTGYKDVLLECPIHVTDARWNDEFDLEIEFFHDSIIGEDPEGWLGKDDNFCPDEWRFYYDATPAEMLIAVACVIAGLETHPNVEIKNRKVVFKGKWAWMNEALKRYKEYRERKCKKVAKGGKK